MKPQQDFGESASENDVFPLKVQKILSEILNFGPNDRMFDPYKNHFYLFFVFMRTVPWFARAAVVRTSYDLLHAALASAGSSQKGNRRSEKILISKLYYNGGKLVIGLKDGK